MLATNHTHHLLSNPPMCPTHVCMRIRYTRQTCMEGEPLAWNASQHMTARISRRGRQRMTSVTRPKEFKSG